MADRVRLAGWATRRALGWLPGGAHPAAVGRAVHSLLLEPPRGELLVLAAHDGAGQLGGGAIVTEAAHPALGGPGGMAYFLAASTRSHGRGLLDALEGHAVARGWRFAELCVAESDAGLVELLTADDGWRRAFVVVRRSTAALPQPPPLPAGVSLRPARAGDAEFVVTMVERGLRLGLGGREAELASPSAVAGAALRLLDPARHPDAVVLIAEEDGCPVGYALAHLSARDELTGWEEAELIDADVVDDRRGSGIAAVLATSALAVAARCGVPSIRGTVAHRSTEMVDRVLAGLLGLGWQQCEVHVRKVDVS